MREEEFITSSCSALFSSTRSMKLRETPGQAGFRAVLLSGGPCSCSILQASPGGLHAQGHHALAHELPPAGDELTRWTWASISCSSQACYRKQTFRLAELKFCVCAPVWARAADVQSLSLAESQSSPSFNKPTGMVKWRGMLSDAHDETDFQQAAASSATHSSPCSFNMAILTDTRPCRQHPFPRFLAFFKKSVIPCLHSVRHNASHAILVVTCYCKMHLT